jgi:hypothetical protein
MGELERGLLVTLQRGECGNDGDVQRAGAAEPRSGRHIGIGDQRHRCRRPEAECGRVQDEVRIIDGRIGSQDLDLGTQLVGAEEVAVLAPHRLGPGEETDRCGDDGAALIGGEGRDVGPGAGRSRAGRERRRGRRDLVSDVPLAQGDEFTAGIHLHAEHTAVHALDAAGVIEECRRDGVENSRCAATGSFGTAMPATSPRRAEMAEGNIAGHSHDGGGEVVGGAVNAIEEGGKLELANGDGKAGVAELGLEHLFEDVVAGADGEELEGNRRGGSRRVGGRRVGASDATKHPWWNRSRCWRREAVGITVDDFLAIDGGGEALADGEWSKGGFRVLSAMT